MKAVMWDVMRADELAEINSYKDSTYRTIAKHQGLYQSIFDLHHTTKAAFRNSVTFYQNHPDILKTVIDSIQRQLDSSRQKKQDTISIKSKAPL
jgi:hypothetical protein